jgi:outer membrane protein TolC
MVNKLKHMKKWILPVLLITVQSLPAQEATRLTLAQAYELSQKNYPVIKQKDLVRQAANININNLQKGFLPQVVLSGQASYQSDVTKVDIHVPGVSIEPPSKDQYKIVADVNQLIYDGGATKEQKTMQLLHASVEEQKVEVELYKVKERINQIYLSILFLDEQMKQVELVKADLNTGIKRLEAQVVNGTAFKSNLSMLKAELLKTDQRAIEIRGSRKGFVEALALFMGVPLMENVQLEKPRTMFSPAIDITRPELKLYEAQTKQNDHQVRLITAKNTPKASLFLQGGYGRPGLNMLKNDFDLYYIGGVRLNWSLGGLYTKKKDRELVEINKKIIDIQRETFVLNTNTQLKQQQSEIEKLEQLIATDREIIELRHSVTTAAKAQLENGVITANDYLKEVTAEDMARQSLITHEVQLLQSQINYQTISGKQ